MEESKIGSGLFRKSWVEVDVPNDWQWTVINDTKGWNFEHGSVLCMTIHFDADEMVYF